MSNSGTLTSGSWCCGSWVFAPRCSECGRRQDVATHAPERVRILRESMAILGRNLAVAGALERARLAGYVLGFYWESNDGLWRPNVNVEAAP